MGSNELILFYSPVDCTKSGEYNTLLDSSPEYTHIYVSLHMFLILCTCLLVHGADEDGFIAFFKYPYIGTYGVGLFSFVPQISRPCPLNGVTIWSQVVFICHDFTAGIWPADPPSSWCRDTLVPLVPLTESPKTQNSTQPSPLPLCNLAAPMGT